MGIDMRSIGDSSLYHGHPDTAIYSPYVKKEDDDDSALVECELEKVEEVKAEEASEYCLDPSKIHKLPLHEVIKIKDFLASNANNNMSSAAKYIKENHPLTPLKYIVELLKQIKQDMNHELDNKHTFIYG